MTDLLDVLGDVLLLAIIFWALVTAVRLVMG